MLDFSIDALLISSTYIPNVHPTGPSIMQGKTKKQPRFLVYPLKCQIKAMHVAGEQANLMGHVQDKTTRNKCVRSQIRGEKNQL